MTMPSGPMQNGPRLAALCCVLGLAVLGMSSGAEGGEAGRGVPEEQQAVGTPGPATTPSGWLRAGPFGDGAKVVVDDWGVWVTAPVLNSSGNTDFVTIRYDHKGNKKWARRYNGPANKNDSPTGIASGGSGYVYVTGASETADGTTDFATVKYAPGGKKQWARRYDGPAGSYDFPVGVAVGKSGYVYVTGDAGVTDHRWDYSTIQYSPAGKQMWNKRYNGPYKGSSSPAAMYLDDSGYLYVTGHSQSGENTYDFATACYTSSGALQWAGRYSRPDSDYNFPVGVVESGGYVYVGGSTQTKSGANSYTVVKYNGKNGKRVWTSHYKPKEGLAAAMALASGKKGSVYLAGTSGNAKFQTVKFGNSGDIDWTDVYTQTLSADNPTAMCSDHEGGVCVTGQSEGKDTGTDFLTIRYGPGGKILWMQRFNGKGNGDDTPTGVTVDYDGYTYVTGWSRNSEGDRVLTTIRYDPNGVQDWVRYFP